jgi:hypothetical protein
LAVLTKQENRVVELKYKSKPIGELTDAQQSAWAKALLLKIHVITGWTIPNSDELLNILSDQFMKKLVETYPQLNTDEIEYAFRQHGTTIQDWGKAMNLNLLDSVLLPYINKRFLLSENERRLKDAPVEQKIFTQDELDNSAREDAERQYQLHLKGIKPSALEINKAILVKDGIMKDFENIHDFYKSCKERGYRHLYVRS